MVNQNTPLPNPEAKKNPLRLTIVLFWVVVILSGISYLGFGRSFLYYLLTAPFNVSIEDNLIGNLGIFILIVAFFEFYLRTTHRNRQALYGFISIIVTCFAFQASFAFLTHSTATGTSGIGSAMMVSIILIIYKDLVERFNFTLRSKSILQWIALPIIILVGGLACIYMLYLYLGFYIVNNPSAVLHLIAAGASIVVYFNVMKLTHTELTERT